MKIKYFLSISAVALSLMLISWGYTGHRTIGLIASHHLNATATLAIKNLLGDTSIADACTWADDVKKDPQFSETGNWHFLDLPLGLNFEEFKQHIDTMGKDNIYQALTKAEQDLMNKETPRQDQVYALKFILHLVGDLHQPMHISRAEDKGGNTIQLNFADKGTNLHSLYDTKMLEFEGLDYVQLAAKYDNVSKTDIEQWQSDSVLQWSWESYQISSQLYAEIDTMGKRVIDEEYYQKHLPIVERRIQQAAIRLAGVLNKIYPEQQAVNQKTRP